SRRAGERVDAAALQEESALQMRVSKKSDVALGVFERQGGLGYAGQVFVFIEWRSVGDLVAVDGQRTARQAADILGIFRRELAQGPYRGRARQGIEPLEILGL